MNADYPISELRIVETYLKDNHIPQIHYMHMNQVATFVQATIQLHDGPGNPHLTNEDGTPKDGRLDNLWKIRVVGLETETKSYWWCVPDLHGNDNPKGAQLNQTNPPLRGWVWMHPELLQQIERERREDLEEEARG